MSEEAERLYQDALIAVEVGNPQKAIDLLKQVVEEDPERVDAWTELAKLLEDRDERRIALTTILQLEPDNAFAKAELEETEKPEKVKNDESEFVPGITRREIRLVAIGLTVYTLLVCGLVFIVVSAKNSQVAAADAAKRSLEEGLTQTPAFLTQVAQETFAAETQISIDGTQTQEAKVSPTPLPSNTPPRANALPTVIPTEAIATPTTISFRGDKPTPPPLPGQVFAWGGRTPGNDEFKNLLVYRFDSIQSKKLNNDRVQFPTSDMNGAGLVYMQQVSGGWILFRMNPQNAGAGGEVLNNLYGNQQLNRPMYPRLSADGKKLAFVGTSVTDNKSTVYVMDFTDRSTLRVTSDAANYTAAAISPDGTKVVAVRDDGTATDMVLIDLSQPEAGYPQTPLTKDGSTILESLPAFAPDGMKIVYTATAGDKPGQGDLYILQLTGGQATGSLPIITDDGDDNFASFDPTGNFVIFASNRVNNVYNIFVYDINGKLVYQFTEESQSVYPGNWTN